MQIPAVTLIAFIFHSLLLCCTLRLNQPAAAWTDDKPSKKACSNIFVEPDNKGFKINLRGNGQISDFTQLLPKHPRQFLLLISHSKSNKVVYLHWPPNLILVGAEEDTDKCC
jgi:hypothetical protein